MQSMRMIRRPEVSKKTGLSVSTLTALERAGDFPAHFLLTARCAVWDEAEVDAWLAARKAKPVEGVKGPISPAMARRVRAA